MIYQSNLQQLAIVYEFEGSFSPSIPIGDNILYGNVVFPHSLGYAPLIVGEYSFTPDFTETYQIGPQHNSWALAAIFGIVWASASDKYIRFAAATSPDRPTIYFRIAAFQNPAETPIVEPVQIRPNWRFNSDYSYPQITIAGTADSPTTLYHGLGKTPIVMCWLKSHVEANPGMGIPAEAAGDYWGFETGASVNVTDQSANLSWDTSLYNQAAYLVFQPR